MNASDLKQEINVYRLIKTPDSFGGFTSTTQLINTFWCKVVETSGNIESKDGRTQMAVTIEIFMRKQTADLILINDILQVNSSFAGNTARYRYNGKYQIERNVWAKLTATKVE